MTQGMRRVGKIDWQERARAVWRAGPTASFIELVYTAGLDPRRDLRFADWSGISFTSIDPTPQDREPHKRDVMSDHVGTVLNEFDFTGARLLESDLSQAWIEGARFDQAEIDKALPHRMLNPNRTNLRQAQDWSAYVNSWRKPTVGCHDDHLAPSSVFQDAPFAPEMVVVPMDLPSTLKTVHPTSMISEILAVGRFPVTFEEWDFYADRSGSPLPSDTRRGRGRRPVININWDDARAYVEWLSLATGQSYRLLTEEEWVYCCFGHAVEGRQGSKSSSKQMRRASNLVGASLSNEHGLHDFDIDHWEWCEEDPPKRNQEEMLYFESNNKHPYNMRVVRSSASPAAREKRGRGYSAEDLGLRVARPLNI
jgi:hypothetical protein